MREDRASTGAPEACALPALLRDLAKRNGIHGHSSAMYLGDKMSPFPPAVVREARDLCGGRTSTAPQWIGEGDRSCDILDLLVHTARLRERAVQYGALRVVLDMRDAFARCLQLPPPPLLLCLCP